MVRDDKKKLYTLKAMLEDINEIGSRVFSFSLKWGIPLKIEIDKEYKENTGRELGKGMIEDIVCVQDLIEKAEKPHKK